MTPVDPKTALRCAVMLLGAFTLAPRPGTSQQVPYLRQVMTDTAGYAAVPAISPDGRWLVWATDRSELESEIWIRAVAGGGARALVTVEGVHRWPTFTPQGDRVVFGSTLPRRGPADQGVYLMAAPFDTRTGNLSAPPRQLTLDPVRQQPRFRWAFSPDGQRVAYMDGITSAVRVVPITGGTATTLLTPPPATPFASLPSWFVWAVDGRSLLYQQSPAAGRFIRYRVSATGGAPVVVAQRESNTFGRPLPGGEVSVDVTFPGNGRAASVTFRDPQGQQIGRDLELPGFTTGQFFPSVDGKHVVIAAQDVTSAIRIVPTAGGPIRNTATPTGYDWPLGWSADSRTVFSLAPSGGADVYRGARPDGQVTATIPTLQDSSARIYRGEAVLGNVVISGRAASGRSGADATFWAINPADGSRRVLTRGIVDTYRGAGGTYFVSGSEYYYSRRVGERIEVRAVNLEGRDRRVTDLPASTLDRDKAVHGNRVAHTETVGDSLRLVVKQNGSAPAVIRTLTRAQVPGFNEFTWSHDGRQLALSLEGGKELEIYSIDASARVSGPPRRISLPVNYQYDMLWMPDGSGFTAIAQMPDQPSSDIVLFRLDDPRRPVVLTMGDDHATWGHVLSPDGQFVAYQSEIPRGGSVWLLDVAKALEEARKR